MPTVHVTKENIYYCKTNAHAVCWQGGAGRERGQWHRHRGIGNNKRQHRKATPPVKTNGSQQQKKKPKINCRPQSCAFSEYSKITILLSMAWHPSSMTFVYEAIGTAPAHDFASISKFAQDALLRLSSS